MPDETKRAKRLGEQLDNANERIKELEAKVANLQTALNLQMANNGTLIDIKNTVDTLITAFTMHINANTDAINSLDGHVNKFADILSGVDRQLELQAKTILAGSGVRADAHS